jgi:hypothetical protein
MSRILAIKGPEGEKEVDYSVLALKEIQKRIKGYEKQYGSYTRFIKRYDCESGIPEDYLILIDLECLLAEIKSRKGKTFTYQGRQEKTPIT